MSTSVDVDEVEAVAADALRWLLGRAREAGDQRLSWPAGAFDEGLDLTLYNGTAGIVPILLEARRHFGDDRYGDAAMRAAASVSDVLDHERDASLYAGLTGSAFALGTVHDELDVPDAAAAARKALDLVRARFDGTRWGEWFDLVCGNAGIGLGALAVGDTELAVRALEPYLRTAERTAAGVHWEVLKDRASRFHHISHGTLGIVYALAGVGRAAGRADFVELARAGAADVVARNEAGPAGFLVPHSDPQDFPDVTPRYGYGWCHGPTGDAQVFRLLHDVLGESAWRDLADRCWYTVTRSGLPRRLHPGFWDANGRCCGTAGVLALASDRMVEQGDAPDFARLLVADLMRRATRDADGARWSNLAHLPSRSTLEPHTGWASGNAGIVRELLRFVRISRGADPGYGVSWPDQPPVRGAAAGAGAGGRSDPR